MKVIQIRHFKVDHQWKKHCSCEDFFEDLNSYNIRPVIETKEINIPIKTVYISTLSRTEETAKYLTGEKNIIKTSLINEVDLRGKNTTRFRLPEIMWYSVSSLKWRFNSKNQKETYRETKKRAGDFLMMIEEKNEDCIVVSHGMFLLVLLELMNNTYNGGRRISKIGNGEIIELVKHT